MTRGSIAGILATHCTRDVVRRKTGSGWCGYICKLQGAEINDSVSYDLFINTDPMSVRAAVAVVITAVPPARASLPVFAADARGSR